MPPYSKKKTFLVLVLVLLAGLLYAAGKATAPSTPSLGPVSPMTSEAIVIIGTPRCLPPAPDFSAVTLECVAGIESDRGLFYALDTQELSEQAVSALYVSERVEVRGSFVPLEALSSSHWQKYETEGIIQVREFVIL